MDFLKHIFQRNTAATRKDEEVSVVGGGFGDAAEPEEQHTPAMENPEEPTAEKQAEIDDINPSTEMEQGEAEEPVDDMNAEKHGENKQEISTERAKRNMELNVRNLETKENAKSNISFTSFQPEAGAVDAIKADNSHSASGAEQSVVTEPNRVRDSRQGTSRKTARSSAEETPRETTDTSENANDNG